MIKNTAVYIEDRQVVPKCHRVVWDEWIQQSDLPRKNFVFSSSLALQIPKKWNVSKFVAQKLLFRWRALTHGFSEQCAIVCVDAFGWARNAITLNLVKELELSQSVVSLEGGDWNQDPMLIIPSSAWNLNLRPLPADLITQFDSFTQAYDFVEEKINELFQNQISVGDENLLGYVAMSSYQSRPWYFYSTGLGSEWVQQIKKLISRKLYSQSVLKEEIFSGIIRPSLQYCLFEDANHQRCSPLLDIDQNFIPPELVPSAQEASRLSSYRLWWRIVLLRLENSLRTKGGKKVLFFGPFKILKKIFVRITRLLGLAICFIKKNLNQKD